MNTYPVYISKRNLNHAKQNILLTIPMIPKREGWHYLAVKYSSI